MLRRRFDIAPLRSIILVILLTRYKRVSAGIAATRSRLRPTSIVLVGRWCGTLLHLLRNELVSRRSSARQLRAPLRFLLLYVFVSRGLVVSHASFLHRKTRVPSVHGSSVIFEITISVPGLAHVQRLERGLEGRIALTRGVTLQL